MKHFYSLLFLLVSVTAFAQIPTGYYNNATGSGYTLKTQLRTIITNGHSPKTYDQLFDLATGYRATDVDDFYENDGSVMDMYSENPTSTDPYNYSYYANPTEKCGNYNSEMDCYNGEHLMPQSVYSSNMPMVGDIHQIIPTDGYVNNGRGSLAFGETNSPSTTYMNGSKRGTSSVSGYTGTVFEPIDEFKGDIARCLLYFAVRYENQVASWNHPMLNGTSDQVFSDWFIALLLDWHNNDAVNSRETTRNNKAYIHQGNRNPFIDHPEYVNLIWNPTPDTEAPSIPTNLIAFNPTDNSISLSWTASTDNIAVTSYDIYVDGTNTFNTNNTAFTATGLTANTNYCFTVEAKDASDNASGISNQACETTTDNGTGNSDEIFFTEYMEGSSNNKALEISNWTFSPIIDLSNYTIKLSSNGSPTWTATYNFPTNASINYGETFVIAHGSLAVCTDVVDDFNNTITAFNGNDAIGLFKNDVLIDIIGTLGDATVFGENVTLQKTPRWYPTPSTTFNINDWDSYPSNTCSDLGSTVIILSTDSFTNEDFNMYPNPVSNTLNVKLKQPKETQIEIYNILGKRVLSKTITQSQSINVENLNSGIYILKLTQGNSTISKKLIKR